MSPYSCDFLWHHCIFNYNGYYNSLTYRCLVFREWTVNLFLFTLGNTEQQPLVPAPHNFPRVLIGDNEYQSRFERNYNQGVDTITLVATHHRMIVVALMLLHNWLSHWWLLWPNNTHRKLGDAGTKGSCSVFQPYFSSLKVKRKNSGLATWD